MAFQSVPNTAEIIVTYLQNSKTVLNTFAAEKAGGYVLADLNVLAAAVDLSVAASWLPKQVAEAAYVNTTVRGLQFENDLEVIDGTSAGPGLVAENGLPGNSTFSIKKLSGQTGRSARGRAFWIGMPRSNLQANLNLLDPVPVTDITAAIDALRIAIDVTTWAPVIVSRFNAGAKRALGVTFPWIASVAVDNELDSQRGRLAS